MNKTPEEHPGLRAVHQKSAWPIWGAAAVWLLAALFLPMFRLWQLALYAVLSAAVWLLLDRLLPGYTEYVPEPAAKADTGDAELNAALDTINRALTTLTQAAGVLSGSRPAAATSLYSVISTIVQIRDDLVSDPSDLPRARRFLNYYLSTTVKLAEKSELLLRQGNGDNVRAMLGSIETSFTMIDQSLRKLLDSLFENDMLDISTDIDVLNMMMTRDGLSEDGMSAAGQS